MDMLSAIDETLSVSTWITRSYLSMIQPNASQYGAAQLGLDSFNPLLNETPLKFLYCVGVEDLSNLT